jgi:hypothetical protein
MIRDGCTHDAITRTWQIFQLTNSLISDARYGVSAVLLRDRPEFLRMFVVRSVRPTGRIRRGWCDSFSTSSLPLSSDVAVEDFGLGIRR